MSFPGLMVLEVEFHDLIIKHREGSLDEFKARKQSEIRSIVKSPELVKDLPIFRAYRDFYWKVGIDPTKIRPAGEALVRRIISGKDLPTINTLVDSYNIASSESHVAIAAFDLDTISSDSLHIRRARSGEAFLGIGMDKPMSLNGIEVVIEDETNSNLIAVYPYRDSDATKITEKTKQSLMMMCGVPGIEDEELQRALILTKRYVEKFCKQH
jgi:DNA/RNA-binding domain of Phe-tRNA-synthetase-like protein